MDRSTREISKITCLKEKEYLPLTMERSMMVHMLWGIWLQVQYIIKMEIGMKVKPKRQNSDMEEEK